MHLLMLYVYGTVVWHELRIYVEEGVFDEMGTVKQSQMAESYSVFNTDSNV